MVLTHLYYITLRRPWVWSSGPPTATCGVPLDPAWCQDHARMDSFRKNRIPEPEIRKNRKIRKNACDLSNQSYWHAGYHRLIESLEFRIRKIRKDRIPDQEIQKKGESGKINFVQRGAGASQKAAEGRILASFIKCMGFSSYFVAFLIDH